MDEEHIGRVVAASSLPDGYTTSLVLERPHVGPDEWPPILRHLANQKLTGLARRFVGEGRLVLSEAQHRELLDVDRFLSLRVLFLEKVLLEVCGVLRAEGIAVRVLKGAALAHLDYPSPQLRPYVDVDVLVPRRQFDEAVRLLAATGAARAHEEPRPGFVARFGKSVELMRTDNASIDLHCSLATGSFAVTVASDDLFDGSDHVVLAGQTVEALTPVDRFVHACLHSVVGNPKARKLLPIRDVVQTLLRLPPDGQSVRSRAAAWRCEAVVAQAVVQAWDTFALTPEPPLVDWARGWSPSAQDQRRIAIATAGESTEAWAGVTDLLGTIPTTRERLSYLGALFFPSRAYLTERDTSTFGRISEALTSVRRRTR